MGALPRPPVAPGPHRELVDALHTLHHRAGWPSLRRLAADTGVSHTTVSKALSSAALPSWGTLELLVEAMGGDVTRFQALWLDATGPAVVSERHGTAIAGRTRELAAVRDHLATGTGLLLVAGEAGIGKTTLVAAAAPAAGTAVVTGHCLHLSREVPLLPVIEVLRTLHDIDDGQWMEEALATCPAYVHQSLSRLLPELDPSGAPASVDPWGPERLLSSVSSLLRALAAARPLAVLLEDCHWADPSTLDLLTHLASTTTTVPVVATWRTDDPDVLGDRADWLSTTRWSHGVTVVDLAPLSLDETAEQLQQLTGAPPSPAEAERIQARTRGLPLYTAQLARTPPDAELPDDLADLLDRRLGDLGAEAWAVVRVLGVAQRVVEPRLLQDVTGLDPETIDEALRVLVGRRLVRSGTGDDAELSHPLFVDAVHRRLVPGEGARVHARLAQALTGATGVEPAEIADHWRAANRPDHEVAHRVAAAHRADERFAPREALSAWLRVLELWDAGARIDGTELWDILVQALEAAGVIVDGDAMRMLASRAGTLDLPDHQRAVALKWMAEALTIDGRHEQGLALLDEALGLLERHPPSRELEQLLTSRVGSLMEVGRVDDAYVELRRGLDVREALGDPRSRRWAAQSAWVTMWSGDLDGAVAIAREALASAWPDLDPVGDTELACTATDVMLHAASPATEVEETVRDTLREIEVHHLTHSNGGVTLRGNICWAYLREGDVTSAQEWVWPVTRSDPYDPNTAYVHLLLGAIELRQGHVQAAVDRCGAAGAQMRSHGQGWADCVPWHAEVELWAGRNGPALALLDEALRVTLPTQTLMTAVLVRMHARASADRLDAEGATASQRRRLVEQLHTMVTGAREDPFAGAFRDASVPASARTWRAELARIEDTAAVEDWTAAAAEWDRIVRPHDAAYCRWRGGHVALRTGRGTIAARLLSRAATDARTHGPLRQAIAATTRGG
jgi:tetratricopeptide (TPR) repeat protein